MKDFLLLKNKEVNHIDVFLKKKFLKSYEFINITLPGVPYLMHIVSAIACDYIEFFYPGYGIDMVIMDCANKGDKSYWLVDKKEYFNRGKKIFNDKKFINKIFIDYKRAKRFFFFISF